MRTLWTNVLINMLVLAMLTCLIGAIPMAIWTGNNLYLFGLFILAFFLA